MTDFTQLMEDYRAMTMASDRHFKGWAPAPITPVVATREQHLYGQKELADALLAVSSELEGWLLFSDRLAILDSNSTPETQIDISNLVYFSLAKKEILQDKRTKALEAIERLSEDLKEM